MGFNRVMLLGKPLRAPSMRWISDRIAVAEFPIVVEKSYKTSSGAEKLSRLEVLVQAYGPIAERCTSQYRDGDVFVEGRIRIEQTKRDDGKLDSHYSIVAERVEFDGAPVEAASAPSAPPAAEARRARPAREPAAA